MVQDNESETTMTVSAKHMDAYMEYLRAKKDKDMQPKYTTKKLLEEKCILEETVAFFSRQNKSCSHADASMTPSSSKPKSADHPNDSDDGSTDSEEEEDPKQYQSLTRIDSFDSVEIKKKKRQTIQAGCIVEYYHPNEIGGKQSYTATISAVKQGGSGFDVEFTEVGPRLLPGLNKSDRVKLIQKMHRRNLVPNADPVWMPLGKYTLRTSKLKGTECAVQKQAAKISALVEAQEETMKQNSDTALVADLMRPTKRRATMFASTTANAAEMPPLKKSRKSEQRANTTTTATSSRAFSSWRAKSGLTKSAPTGSRSAPTTTTTINQRKEMPTSRCTISEDWWKKTNAEEIHAQIDLNRKASAASTSRSRRAKKGSHMSTEHLELVLQVRNRLPSYIEESKGQLTATAVLNLLAFQSEEDDSGLGPFDRTHAENFLAGDKHMVLREDKSKSVAAALKKWLESVDPATKEEDGGNNPLNETMNRASQTQQLSETQPKDHLVPVPQNDQPEGHPANKDQQDRDDAMCKEPEVDPAPAPPKEDRDNNPLDEPMNLASKAQQLPETQPKDHLPHNDQPTDHIPHNDQQDRDGAVFKEQEVDLAPETKEDCEPMNLPSTTQQLPVTQPKDHLPHNDYPKDHQPHNGQPEGHQPNDDQQHCDDAMCKEQEECNPPVQPSTS
eukprot:Sro256_g100620.1 n/a (672) ;mRNA; r:32381-34396